jgi:hypothetical protein
MTLVDRLLSQRRRGPGAGESLTSRKSTISTIYSVTGSLRLNPNANAPRPRWSGSKSNPRPKSPWSPTDRTIRLFHAREEHRRRNQLPGNAYLRSIIDAIEDDDKVIRIHGSKASLEQAVIAGEQIGQGVRSFVRKWRAAADEDGHYCFAVAL